MSEYLAMEEYLNRWKSLRVQLLWGTCPSFLAAVLH